MSISANLTCMQCNIIYIYTIYKWLVTFLSCYFKVFIELTCRFFQISFLVYTSKSNYLLEYPFFCLFIVIQQLHRSISMSPIFPNSNLTVNHLYLLILSSSALFYHSTYGCFWPHLPHFDICDHLWILIN